jgi:cell volume regulation protein A
MIIFLTAAAILALGFLGDMLARRIMLPSVIFLIILGIIFGPVFGPTIGLDRLSLIGVLPILAPLTLAFIAFDTGINMDISRVISESKRSLIFSTLGFLFATITVGVFVRYAFALDWAYSFMLASAWGGVNTTTITAIGRHLRVREETLSTLILSSLIDDIIVLVTALTILNSITLGGLAFEELSVALVSNVAISFFLGVIAGIVWLNIFYVSESEYAYTFTLAAVLSVYSLTEVLGGTGAIAIFIIALILGNSESFCQTLRMKVDLLQLEQLKNSIRNFHSELTFILVTFFFTFVGLIYVFTGVLDLVLGVIVSLLIHLTRYASVWVGSWRSSIREDLPAVGLIVGKGAASVAMSTLPLAYALSSGEFIAGVALNVILFTNLFSIILPFIAKK